MDLKKIVVVEEEKSLMFDGKKNQLLSGNN